MPSCIVKGCTHYTGMKTSNPLLTMHVFPREISRIKLWLQQTGQDFGDIDAFAAKILDAAKSGKYRICSAHFGPGSYTSQGSRIVLKQDAVPTIFPGVYPKPPADWKPFPPQPKKFHVDPNIIGKSDTRLYVNAGTPRATVQRREVGTQTSGEARQGAACHDSSLQGAGRSPTESTCQEQLLDPNGCYLGDSGQNELKPKQTQNICSLPAPRDCSLSGSAGENRGALSSLENILVSLLQHLTDAPLTSRPQKQKTSRLLNQAAEIISILTGEEWTVVKKNAHISKFYQMIQEVPIKCGDVAVFFTMDEWDYIEEHEDLYKHVMLENPTEPKSMQSNTISDCCKEEILLEKKDEQHLNPTTEHTADKEDGVMESQPDTPQLHNTPLPLITDQLEKRITRDEDTDTVTMECSTDDVITDQETDTPPSRRIDSSTEEPNRWDPMDDSHHSPNCELWIAQDGTTSSQWIPQEDPRPPGRRYHRYPRKLPLLQCPVSLSCDTEPKVIPAHSRSDHATSVQEHWCELCDQSFNDRYELIVHQITHAKRQRL